MTSSRRTRPPRRTQSLHVTSSRERRQRADETFESFITDLRNLVKECSYKEPNEMVRDTIICGLHSQTIREKLLNEGDQLKMERAIELAMNHEATQEHLRSMASSSAAADNVDAIQNTRRSDKRQTGHSGQTPTINCRNCGGKHPKKKCPAFGKECLYCHKRNHWAKVCLKKKADGRQIHHVQNHEEGHLSDTDESFYVDAIRHGQGPQEQHTLIYTQTRCTRFALS